MNKIVLLTIAVGLNVGAVNAYAEDSAPGVLEVEATETILKVQTVNYQDRTVILENTDGERVTLKVPPASQNLDQVYAGALVRASYVQSVAVFVSPVGGAPSAVSASTMQLAPKGATPRIVVVDVREIQARVDEIDYDARIAVLTGPEGNRVKVRVDEQVADLNAVNTGDIVVVRYTEALSLGMIPE